MLIQIIQGAKQLSSRFNLDHWVLLDLLALDKKKVISTHGEDQLKIFKCEFSGDYFTSINGVSARENLLKHKSECFYDEQLRSTFFQRRIEPGVSFSFHQNYHY